jgi:hypothetical protein
MSLVVRLAVSALAACVQKPEHTHASHVQGPAEARRMFLTRKLGPVSGLILNAHPEARPIRALERKVAAPIHNHR